jgi:hypothetical protein
MRLSESIINSWYVIPLFIALSLGSIIWGMNLLLQNRSQPAGNSA